MKNLFREIIPVHLHISRGTVCFVN